MSRSVTGAVFEVGQDAGGPAAMAAWMVAQQEADFSHILAILPYDLGEMNYILVLMGDNITVHPDYVGRALIGTFDIQNGLADMLVWLNTKLNSAVPAPAAPVLSLIQAGELTDQGTVYVQTAFGIADGGNNTLPSPESSLAIPDNYQLVVASPVDHTGLAVSYTVFMGTASGQEGTQDNGNDIDLGTPYTLTESPPSGDNAGGENTEDNSGAEFISGICLTKRGEQRLVTLILNVYDD